MCVVSAIGSLANIVQGGAHQNHVSHKSRISDEVLSKNTPSPFQKAERILDLLPGRYQRSVELILVTVDGIFVALQQLRPKGKS